MVADTSWDTRFVRRQFYPAVVGVVGCAVARAPTLLTSIKVPGLGISLAINAGYVLDFGPLVLFLLAAVALLWDPNAAGTARKQFAEAAHGRRLLLIASVLVVMVAAIFLTLQFFLLQAPPGGCDSFNRLRYLYDIGLPAFQPEYCIGSAADMQNAMPWLLYPPALESWLQIAACLGTLSLSIRQLKTWGAF